MRVEVLVKGIVIAIIGLPIFYCGSYLSNNMAAVSQSGNPGLHNLSNATASVGVVVFFIGIIVVCAGILADVKKAGTIGFCSRCGNQLKPGAVSCPKCRLKL